MKPWQQSVLFAVCAFALGSSALANLRFDGTLIEPPPCTINSGGTIVVDFGDVGVNKVDGVNYRKTVASSVSGLGIKILRNGVPFTLNTPLLINPASPPVLEAVPIKSAASTLSPGSFSASATLLAYYQ